MKRILVTAGATQTDIDKVRSITNIFKGKTGIKIAMEAASRGHSVTLICSDPNLVPKDAPYMYVVPYRTYSEFHTAFEKQVLFGGSYDAIIHSAAVSDYLPMRVTTDPNDQGPGVKGSLTKISSDHESLWIELIPTTKLIGLVRTEWAFKGKLVMFKLEVEKTDDELVDIVRPKMAKYGADLTVANCLEWKDKRALLVTSDTVAYVSRGALAAELITRLEA